MTKNVRDERGMLLSAKTGALPRFRLFQLDRIIIAILLLVATIGLTHLSSHATQPDQDCDLAENPSDGTIIHCEVTRLIVPDQLVELAQLNARQPLIKTPEDALNVLKAQGLQDLWYVATMEGQLASGRSTELSFIRHPGRQKEHFREFLSSLALLSPAPAAAASDERNRIIVRRIPDETARLDPRTAIASLLH